MIVKLRPFNKDTDSGFILDTMAKELYKEQFPNAKRYKKKWFEDIHPEILNLINIFDIYVAHDADDEDFLLGYIIDRYFIYVKEYYREQGIATLLSKELAVDPATPYATKLGMLILTRAKEAHMTDHETPSDLKESTTKNLEKLIKNGFQISVCRFQSAILSGYGTAEFELSTTSNNPQRRFEEMHFTSAGVIIKQNGKWFGAPEANLVSWHL